MRVCRDIAVDLSDVGVCNALEYNDKKSPYNNLTEEQLAFLDDKNGFASTPFGYDDRLSSLGPNDHQADPGYWMKVGNKTSQPKMVNLFPLFQGFLPQKVKYGRCWQCSSLVARALVQSQEFRDLALSFEIASISSIGHYFVVVARQPGSDIKDRGTWGANAFIVDIWEANQAQGTNAFHKRARDDQHGQPAVVDSGNWTYEPSLYSAKVHCKFDPPFQNELQVLENL
jgi:hypothetical protein